MLKANNKKHQNDVTGFEQVNVSCINKIRIRNNLI